MRINVTQFVTTTVLVIGSGREKIRSQYVNCYKNVRQISLGNACSI